ncbi:hypothetical protein [Yersinia enterocolitica]|uniref:hypothetical protein n=1 Tax=Yersinia enterocolitica TaxID=630 RepID=UPI00313E99AF
MSEIKQYDTEVRLEAVMGTNHYGVHIHAMTAENLHSKSGIAVELAWRDLRIEQLIAQLEAAQKEVHGLKMKLSDAGCLLVEWKQRVEKAEKERDDLLNQEFQQRLANAEHQLYMKDLAIHNIKASRVAQFRKRLAAEAALSAANEKLNKSVVLPKGYSVRAGHPINEGERHVMIPKEGGRWLSRFDVEHAIRVAGFTVEGE